MSTTVLSVAEIEANQSPRAARSWLAPTRNGSAFAEILPVVVLYSILNVIIYYYLGALGGLWFTDRLHPHPVAAGYSHGHLYGYGRRLCHSRYASIKTALGIGLPLAMGFFPA